MNYKQFYILAICLFIFSAIVDISKYSNLFCGLGVVFLFTSIAVWLNTKIAE